MPVNRARIRLRDRVSRRTRNRTDRTRQPSGSGRGPAQSRAFASLRSRTHRAAPPTPRANPGFTTRSASSGSIEVIEGPPIPSALIPTGPADRADAVTLAGRYLRTEHDPRRG